MLYERRHVFAFVVLLSLFCSGTAVIQSLDSEPESGIPSDGEFVKELVEKIRTFDIGDLQTRAFEDYVEGERGWSSEVKTMIEDIEAVLEASTESLKEISERLTDLYEGKVDPESTEELARQEPRMLVAESCMWAENGCSDELMEEKYGDTSILFHGGKTLAITLAKQDEAKWKLEEELKKCSKRMKSLTGREAACSFILDKQNTGRVYPGTMATKTTVDSLKYMRSIKEYYHTATIYFAIDASKYMDENVKKLFIQTITSILKSVSSDTNALVIFFTNTYEVGPLGHFPVNVEQHFDDIIHYVNNGPYDVVNQMTPIASEKGLLKTLTYIKNSLSPGVVQHPMAEAVYELLEQRFYSSNAYESVCSGNEGNYKNVYFVKNEEINMNSYKLFYNNIVTQTNSVAYVFTEGIKLDSGAINDDIYKDISKMYSIVFIMPPFSNSFNKINSQEFKNINSYLLSNYYNSSKVMSVAHRDIVLIASHLDAPIFEIGYNRSLGSTMCANPGAPKILELFYGTSDSVELKNIIRNYNKESDIYNTYKSVSGDITDELVYRALLEPLLVFELCFIPIYIVTPYSIESDPRPGYMSVSLNTYSREKKNIIGYVSTSFDLSLVMKLKYAQSFDTHIALVSKDTRAVIYENQQKSSYVNKWINMYYSMVKSKRNIVLQEMFNIVDVTDDLRKTSEGIVHGDDKGDETILLWKNLASIRNLFIYGQISVHDFNPLKISSVEATAPLLCYHDLTYSSCPKTFNNEKGMYESPDNLSFYIPEPFFKYSGKLNYELENIEVDSEEFVSVLEQWINGSYRNLFVDSEEVWNTIHMIAPNVVENIDIDIGLDWVNLFIVDMKTGVTVTYPASLIQDDYNPKNVFMNVLDNTNLQKGGVFGPVKMNVNGEEEEYVASWRAVFNDSTNYTIMYQFIMGVIFLNSKFQEYVKSSTQCSSTDGKCHDILIMDKRGYIIYDSVDETKDGDTVFDKHKDLSVIMINGGLFEEYTPLVTQSYFDLECSAYRFVLPTSVTTENVSPTSNLLLVKADTLMYTGELNIYTYRDFDIVLLHYYNLTTNSIMEYFDKNVKTVGCTFVENNEYDLVNVKVKSRLESVELVTANYLSIPNEFFPIPIAQNKGITSSELSFLFFTIFIAVVILILRSNMGAFRRCRYKNKMYGV